MEKVEKNQKKTQSQKAVGKAKSQKGKNDIVKYPAFFWRFLLVFSLVVMVLLLLFIGYKKFTTVKKDRHVALVEKQLSFCKELVSGKYRYSDVIALKKHSGLARSYSIVKYSGIIRAGISDISLIEYEVDGPTNSVVLKVPHAQLLGNEICSQEVFDEKQSIFVPITAQEIFQEIQDAKDAEVQEILDNGLLDESWDQAARIIQQLMYGCGFEDVHVVLK